MMPDFNNDGKRSAWEGAAADLWQREERKRAAGDGKYGKRGDHAPRTRQRRPAPTGGGCSNVALGGALILGLALVAAILLVIAFNLISAG